MVEMAEREERLLRSQKEETGKEESNITRLD